MLSPDESSAAEALPAPQTLLAGVSQRLDVDSIGAQDEWLRRLARGLVRDEHEADDLVQETLLVALEKAPMEVGEPRGWLAGVMRHRLSTRRRAERSHSTATGRPAKRPANCRCPLGTRSRPPSARLPGSRRRS